MREAFTQKTTEEMWARNPDYKKFPAVACYNKGYRLQNAGGVDGKLSVKVELGLLNTKYVYHVTTLHLEPINMYY